MGVTAEVTAIAVVTGLDFARRKTDTPPCPVPQSHHALGVGRVHLVPARFEPCRAISAKYLNDLPLAVGLRHAQFLCN